MANRTGTVVSDGLTLRASPDGEGVDELSKGDRLEIVREVHPGKLNWLNVQVIKARGTAQQGLRGYVAEKDEKGNRFVLIDDQGPYVPPRPQPPEPPIDYPEAWPSKLPVAALVGGGLVVLIIAFYALLG